MPFKSQAQEKWMFSQKPKMAERWAKETPNLKTLPKKIGTPKTTKTAAGRKR